MNHPAFTHIKWTFLLLGMALLVGAGQTEGELQFVLGLIGTIFFLVGAGIVFYTLLSGAQDTRLRQEGKLVQADFQQVELNTSLAVNGTNPFRVVAQWHDTLNNELRIFKSANLWFDPSQFVQGRKIPVYVDLHNPSKYFVDLSFLPKVRT